MGSRFYVGFCLLLSFADRQFDDSGSDDDTSLPFPKPLARSSFLVDDFVPSVFLASLSNRYQTLDDLGNELRGLSQSLTKELLDLVNDNCHDYLLLGTTLQGGNDRVEEVRLGLLSSQRELSLILERVVARRAKVAGLIEHRKKLAAETQTANTLLDFENVLQDLEAALLLESGSVPEFDDDDDLSLLDRLEHQVEQFGVLLVLSRRESKHPYILSQVDRIAKVRSTLALDLKSAGQEDSQDRIAHLLTFLSDSPG